MGRSLWLILFLLSLGACTSAANAPAIDPTVTPTITVKDETLGGCQALPGAVLSYGDGQQANARVTINWQSDDCVINGHPFFTLPLPEMALQVPQGANVQLAFSVKPEGVWGYAWRPDFRAAEEPAFDRIEVPLDDLRGSTRVDIEFEQAASQQVDLSTLDPGDYAIEVFAAWDDGSSGFAFHVEIVEP